MTGQEIIDALKQGIHVEIEDSTGRWLHAVKLSDPNDPTQGVDGYNQYGDSRTRGLSPTLQYNAYAPECNGCKE